jgi:hypothetical protein
VTTELDDIPPEPAPDNPLEPTPANPPATLSTELPDPQPEPGHDSQPAHESKPRFNKPFFVVVGGVIALLTLAVGAVAALSGDDDDSMSLTEIASTIDSPHIEVADDGASLLIDGDGEESSGASLDDIVLTLGLLDTPSSVVTRMSSTRALDGMQDATWGDYTASWTYHPDNGLDIIVTVEK